MTIALFPLEIARTDDHAGTVARQMWRAVLAVLPGLDAMPVTWLATRGDTPAHVVLESALPLSVVRGEAEERGCTQSVVGRVERTPVAVSITTGWVDASEERPGPTVSEPSLHAAVRALARALFPAQAMRMEGIPTNDEALLAWMSDIDNGVIVKAGGLDALAHPEDAYQPLLTVLRADPSFAEAAVTLRARCEHWVREGHVALAEACTLALESCASAMETEDDATERAPLRPGSDASDSSAP
jgi:hypothetical protein